MNTLSRFQPMILAMMRIATAYMFMLHGTAKLFAMPHIAMFDGITIWSLYGMAGILMSQLPSSKCLRGWLGLGRKDETGTRLTALSCPCGSCFGAEPPNSASSPLPNPLLLLMVSPYSRLHMVAHAF